MYTRIIFLSFFILSIFYACSPVIKTMATKEQVSVDQKNAANDNRNICFNWEHYVPDTSQPALHPVRTIKVNFHFINNTSGTANFSETEGVIYAHDLIYNANQRLSNNKKMNLPPGNNTPVVPINIRFEITPDPNIPGDDGIYFHYDDSLYFVNNQDGFKTLFDRTPLEKYAIQKDTVLNIFMLEHPLDSLESPTYKLAENGVGFDNWLKMVSSYQKNSELFYMDGDKPIYKGAWHMARLFNHEILHSLGLPHSWNVNDGCDDTPRHPNCWNYSDTPPCDTMVSNNMMDYNQESNALTPCQIGRLHSFMYKENNSGRFLKKTWCQRDPNMDITIYRGDTTEWKGSRYIEGNITINKGAILKIYCQVSMPTDGKIIIKPGGQLIVDGTLTNTCGEEWEGIEIWKRKNDSGMVILSGNGKILNVKNQEDVIQNK